MQNDDARGRTPTDSTGSSAANGPTTRRLSVGEIRRSSPKALGTGAVLALAAAAILFYANGGRLFQANSLTASLQLAQEPYSALFPLPTLSIKNIGEKPIAIQDISINDRSECTTIPANNSNSYGVPIDGNKFNANLRHQMWIVYPPGLSSSIQEDIDRGALKSPPVVLRVGEEMRRPLSCLNTSIANVTVSTDQGTGSWRWNQ